MTARWFTVQEVRQALHMTEDEFAWYQDQFRAQVNLLSRQDGEGRTVYSPDILQLLRGVSAMISQGATAEQIKGWFGMA